MSLNLEKLYIKDTSKAFLAAETQKALKRFPRLLDERLMKGLERVMVNTPQGFLNARSPKHLRLLIMGQFFLQKKIEASLRQGKTHQKPLFLKLFRQPSLVGIALVCHSSYGFLKEQLLKAFHTLLPGIQEVPSSSYVWQDPDLPYIFCYLEVHKLRGEDLSLAELQEMENALVEQLLVIPPLTPALFWPYNEEESYRQIQLLQREITNPDDLPHVSIHFQEQSPSSLEFLIHVVRPKYSPSLEETLRSLPEALYCYCHFYRVRETPFPIELGSFSFKVPSLAFDVRDSINLLYVRRYILKYLGEAIGPFRDYNGGLFEKQQHHFEVLSMHLRDKVPHFDLFAEKVFYALHPVEVRFSLSLAGAEELFSAFSELMRGERSFITRNSSENILIIKTLNSSDFVKYNRLRDNCEKTVSHAQLTLGDFHYLCLLGLSSEEASSFLNHTADPLEKTKTLSLIFQEGAPLSLNPYHSSGDMRSRVLSKLLFEGLTRLNAQGKPEFAGATQCIISPDKLFYTFKLRPYRWSNGESVTAFDYATSWQYALSDRVSHPELLFVIKNARKFKENKCPSSELGIRAVDAETLQVALEWQDPHFLHKLAQPFFFPLFGSMREPKWFNGPYLVREHTKDNLLLSRNPYFWQARSKNQDQQLFFEQVDIRWTDNADDIYDLFQEGKVEWIGDPLNILSPQCIERLQKEGKIYKQKVARRFLICFNTKHPLLSSSLIRRSLSLAINRSLICETIFPHSEPLAPLIPDPKEAALLFEKGLDELGLTRESFPPLTFSYSHQTRREKLALCLQQSWKEVLGISVGLERVEWNLFRNKLEKGCFEISGTIQDIPDEDPLEFLNRFEGPSSWNFSQWNHSLYREIMTRAKEEKALLMDADKILSEEVPFTPLFSYMHLYAHHPHLEGYLFDPEGCVDFSSAYISYIKNR